MLTLLYTRDGQTCRHELTPGDTIVGRASICDLTIEDPSISRRHARFRIHGDRCVLTDLGGRNGTFLNGEQVTEAQVHHGDAIVLGRFPLRVENYQPPSTILSDEHSLIETDRTVVRRVDDDTETRAGVQPAAHSERLLLLLTEISRQLVRWQPLPEILNRIAAVVFDTIAVERAFILLLDQETGDIVPHVARSRSGEVVSHASLSRTIVRRVIEERIAILAGDVRLESKFAALQSVQDAQIRSFMCTPLWNQSRVIGVLYVDNPHTAQLTAADLDVLQALSSYAAVAIEQARLTEQILQETRRREALQRYHPAAVVERILAKGIGADAPFMAEERDVTVLFADSRRAAPQPVSWCDVRRGVRGRRHAGQVHRRCRARRVRRTARAARSRGTGTAGCDGDAPGRRLAGSSAADCASYRGQFRNCDRGRHRIAEAPGVHGPRRCREHLRQDGDLRV
jgi:adenylate cyclase